MRRKLSNQEIREALTGPNPSLSIPFCQDGSIDYKGLKNEIEFFLQAGSKIMLLTYGDSLFSILTDQEVAEVTKAVIEQTAGRAMVVGAERQWWTGKTVEFAKYLDEIGADLFMVLPPNWAGSCTVDTFVEHYTAVARHIPVMIVTGVFSTCQSFGLKTLEILRDKVPGVVAIKDDVCGGFARKMGLLLHDKWAIYSGGLKQNFLDVWPYGCDGYLSTFMKFKPDIAHQFWKAIKAKDMLKVRGIIATYEIPWFDFIASLPGGFDAGIHGTMELFGICQRWRRKPYHSLTDQEMEKLADLFRNLGLL